MSERIAYQFNGDHVLKFAGMQKLTGEQVADELNRLYTIIAEQNEKVAVLERMVEALRKDAERLNYIERNWFYRDAFGELTFIFNEAWSAGVHETLRDAIDAEINKALAGGEAG